jgi:hypothetical protein
MVLKLNKIVRQEILPCLGFRCMAHPTLNQLAMAAEVEVRMLSSWTTEIKIRMNFLMTRWNVSDGSGWHLLSNCEPRSVGSLK